MKLLLTRGTRETGTFVEVTETDSGDVRVEQILNLDGRQWTISVMFRAQEWATISRNYQ